MIEMEELVNKTKHVISNLETPMGQQMLKLLLSKTGDQILKLIDKSTLEEFIDCRCEQFLEHVGDAFQSERFLRGSIGHAEVMEKARAEAFEGLN